MTRIAIALALFATAAPAVAQEKETEIAFASNGGIVNYENGPKGSNIVFLQDRTLKWYRVTMTGPCLPTRSLDTMNFTTNSSGAFDRFSQIKSLRFPAQVCGVTSIVASPPPPGHPGAPK